MNMIYKFMLTSLLTNIIYEFMLTSQWTSIRGVRWGGGTEKGFQLLNSEQVRRGPIFPDYFLTTFGDVRNDIRDNKKHIALNKYQLLCFDTSTKQINGGKQDIIMMIMMIMMNIIIMITLMIMMIMMI